MLVVSSGLLLTAWIIGWVVFEIPGRWIHVLPVMALIPMVAHVRADSAGEASAPWEMNIAAPTTT